ncbi:MAG TPA: hypothetical protein VFB79_15315, partial [Candidatus Angelobacter sp.]|nr:hypothetical protein [Candidatus Angelobacter sp.]
FPHESTGNQWFNESQTESYRMLGLCSVTDIFQSWDPQHEFEEVINSARRYLKPIAKGAAGAQM